MVHPLLRVCGFLWSAAFGILTFVAITTGDEFWMRCALGAAWGSLLLSSLESYALRILMKLGGGTG